MSRQAPMLFYSTLVGFCHAMHSCAALRAQVLSPSVPCHLHRKLPPGWICYIPYTVGTSDFDSQMFTDLFIKNRFPKNWVIASSLAFFSLNRSNRVSKNPSFHTDFKNIHMILVKSAPKKSIAQKNDFFRTLANFQLVKYVHFWNRYEKTDFLYPIRPIHRKKVCITSLKRDNELFWAGFRIRIHFYGSGSRGSGWRPIRIRIRIRIQYGSRALMAKNWKK